MPKSSVADYDPVAANNSDIGGINIAEGCPAAGINNALRELMAQIAAWRNGTIGALLPKTGGAMTGDVTGLGTDSTVKDPGGTARRIGFRNIPLRAASAQQTLALSDVGQLISISTGGIVIPANASTGFEPGDAISVYNNSGSAQTISTAVGVTLRLVGSASTGSRTLAVRGLATLIKVTTDEWIASGSVS